MKFLISSLVLALGVTVCQSSEYNDNFYLRKLDPYCSNFNYSSGACEKCYTGYYVGVKGQCQQNSPLCASCNKYGQCTQCFDDYILINGGCFYKAVQQKPKQVWASSDPLCADWNGNKCLSCVAGCYMNQRGVCNIEDPNCQRFNYEREVCEICLRGYKLDKNKCVRKY